MSALSYKPDGRGQEGGQMSVAELEVYGHPGGGLGAGVTLDIGHAHVCSSRNPGNNIYERYIMPHRDRIVSAHIYHTEQSRVGHVAPRRIEDLHDRLELLKGAPSCTWWVIELKNRRDILQIFGGLS